MILSRIFCVAIGFGVMWAGVVLGRIMAVQQVTWVRRMRVLIVGLATYASMTFLHAAIAGVPVHDALHPGGLLQALPFVLQGAFIGGFVILPLGCIAAIIRAGVLGLRARAVRPIWFQAIALTTCFALLITSLELGLGEKRFTPEARIALLDRSLRALADGERDMPRDTWDPDYVVKMVGHDPQMLFRWVQQNTYWIPYHGVLRGPVGVLMDRQGNSLDRAILLAVLLQKAGYAVRLAHGELSREQALEVLPRLEAARVTAFTRPEASEVAARKIHPVLAKYQMDNAVGNATVQSQQRFSAIASELHSRVSDQTDRLLKMIQRPEPAEAWAHSLEDAISALTDHWWVQGHQAWNWVDLDLLAKSAGVSLATATQTTAIKDLPADLHHSITVRIIAEQWSGGTLTEHKTLEQLLRPSDLYGHSVVLQFFPSEWFDSDTFTSLQNHAGALAQHEWDAFLSVDRTLVTAGVLSENGDDSNAVKGGEMGGLATAFSATMGIKQKNDNRQLSAVWIEYEIHVPQDKSRTIRRAVFDLLGASARSTPSPTLALDDSKRLTRSLALTMKTEIMPQVCDLSPEFVSVLLAHHLVTDRDLFAFMIKGALPAGTTSIDQLVGHSEPSPSTLYALALVRRELTQKSQTFIARPNVLSRHSYPVPAGDGIGFVDATDIVTNEIGVGVSVRDPFNARLAQGVLDTNAESLFQPHEGISAGDAFAASRAWRVVGSAGDSAAVAKVKLSEDVRRQIVTDLNAGYSVVAPEKVISTRPTDFTGWWRIDSRTGTALGMGANGWGVAANENSQRISLTARLSPGWKNAINRFATFGMTFLGAYGWCVTPLVLNQIHPVDLAKDIYSQPLALQNVGLKHSLGIWKGAIIPSVRECVGDSVFIAGITAWLLPVGVVGKAAEGKAGGRFEGMEPPGQSEPIGSPGTGSKGNGGGKTKPDLGPSEPGGAPNEPNPEAKPPKDEPCNDANGGTGDPSKTQVDPNAKPPDPGPGPQGTTAQQLQQQLTASQDAVFATRAAAEDAVKEFTKSFNEMGQYRQDHNVKFGEGTITGDATFDPNVYEQLVETNKKDFTLAQDALEKSTEAQQAYEQAKQAWDKFVNQQLNGQGGQCGGGGAPRGSGAGANAGPAGAKPGVDPLGKTQPDGAPTINDPNAQWDGNTQPGGFEPPTPVNDPSGKTIPGVGDPNVPNEPSGKTLPGIGPAPTDSGPSSGPSQSWDNQPCSWCSSAVPNFPDTPSNSNSPPWDLGPGLHNIWNGIVGAANATDGVGPLE